MTASGVPLGLRIGVPAGRVPGLPASPELSVRVVVARGQDRDPPLPASLAALAARLDLPGHRWVAAASGDRDALGYLAELRGPSANLRPGRLVAVVDGRDPYLEVLLGGERALGHTVTLLQADAAEAEAVARALAAGADPLEQAGRPGIRLAMRHRPGEGWALLAWPAARSSPLAGSGLDDSDEPISARGHTAAVRAGRTALPMVLAALLGAAALVITLHRGGSPPTVGTTGGAHTPTPVATPNAPPTFASDVPGDAPPARQLASTAYDAATGTGVLFGGIAQGPGAGDLADTWTWGGNHWVHRTPADAPSGRSAAAMAYDPGRGGVLLFGGVARGRAGTRMEDTWLWDGADWTAVPARAGPGPGSVTIGMAWVPERATMLLVTDPGVVGGPPETWTWDGAGWSPVAGARTPEMRLVATDPRSGGVLGVSAGDIPGPASTWLWNGTEWNLATATGLEFEPFTATMVSDPVHGDVVLTEQLFADAAGPTGGTWTWDRRAWVHHGGDVPDILRTFDTTQALWAVAAGHLDLVGGPRDSATYHTGWEWDGDAWHRL